MIKQFSKYAFGGIFTFGTKIGLTYLLTEFFNIDYFISYVATLTVVILIGFFYNAYVTYEVTQNKRKNFAKYCVALVIFYLLDAGGVRMLTEAFGVYYIASIVIVTLILFVVKYFAYKRYVFR